MATVEMTQEEATAYYYKALMKALGRIEELEKLLVDTANWDNLSKEQSEELIELHKKYYPENYK